MREKRAEVGVAGRGVGGASDVSRKKRKNEGRDDDEGGFPGQQRRKSPARPLYGAGLER